MQFQVISQSERQKNRTAIKSLICCTHFLARNHIAHTTNFDKLVDLVVACGGENLKNCWEEGTVYIKSSCCGVTRCYWDLGRRNTVKATPSSTVLFYQCTDVSTIEELSIYCCWIENGEAFYQDSASEECWY